MDTKVTLGYWAIRGLAQRIRQLLEYCGVPYEEVRYEQAEGRRKWFEEVKPVLSQKNAALTLPYLIDGDKVISESDAICVYICHKADKKELLGRTADEQVNLATVLGIYKDFHPHYIRLVYGAYGEIPFEAALKENIENFLPYLSKLNGFLGNRQFFCGDLTWVDFAMADFFQTLHLLQSNMFASFPQLLQYQKRVWSLPQLQSYFSSNRFHERPCNNYTAKWK